MAMSGCDYAVQISKVDDGCGEIAILHGAARRRGRDLGWLTRNLDCLLLVYNQLKASFHVTRFAIVATVHIHLHHVAAVIAKEDTRMSSYLQDRVIAG
jgi:hypothetical protein